MGVQNYPSAFIDLETEPGARGRQYAAAWSRVFLFGTKQCMNHWPVFGVTLGGETIAIDPAAIRARPLPPT
jgi:hypothetical protein